MPTLTGINFPESPYGVDARAEQNNQTFEKERTKKKQQEIIIVSN